MSISKILSVEETASILRHAEIISLSSKILSLLADSEINYAQKKFSEVSSTIEESLKSIEKTLNTKHL